MTRNAVPGHLKVTVGESVVAATAATVSLLVMNVPVWAMFIGWISFFTRGINFRSGVINLACVFVGLACGMVAAVAVAALTPSLGSLSFTVVVFVVAMVVLSLRLVPVFNNVLGFFLGLVAYFASYLPPSAGTFAQLGVAAAVGSAAGWLASLVNARWGKSHAPAA